MRRMMIVVFSLSLLAACEKKDAAKVDPKTDPVAKTDPAPVRNRRSL